MKLLNLPPMSVMEQRAGAFVKKDINVANEFLNKAKQKVQDFSSESVPPYIAREYVSPFGTTGKHTNELMKKSSSTYYNNAMTTMSEYEAKEAASKAQEANKAVAQQLYG